MIAPALPSPLREALVDPAALATVDLTAWNVLLPFLHHHRVLGRVAITAREAGIEDHLPAKVRERLTAARAEAAQHRRLTRWEIDRVHHALAGLDVPILLLKGAAYLAADLPSCRGRLATDVDILVPRERLAEVERRLLERGWETEKHDAYDQRYYRQWMHELPPLRHRTRGSVLDVHHTITPPSGRLRPDSAAVLADSIPVEPPGMRVPNASDLCLHCAVHLYQDGDFAGGLRDLTDLHDLLTHFAGRDAGFWRQLTGRAAHHGLERPLSHALRGCAAYLGTVVPPEAFEALRKRGPSKAASTTLDAVVRTAMLQRSDGEAPPLAGAAHFALYVRSHWLRMPPHLLTAHLARKGWRRWKEREERREAG